MPDIPTVGELAKNIFDAFKDRFEVADVWEGKPDVEQLRFAAEMGGKIAHAMLVAPTPADRKYQENTLKIVDEAIGFKIAEKGIKLNKFGKSFLGEAIQIATRAVAAALIGLL